MNRYNPIKTTDEKIMVLDTIIRMPENFLPRMTREAQAIREAIPALSIALLRSKQRAAVVCAVIGTGWEPMPELSYIDRAEAGRLYKRSITKLAAYLEEKGELYDELEVV
jgi:adenosyl cobinamide kinase/adenosyl cobinamide phosphate guanylyltransferase